MAMKCPACGGHLAYSVELNQLKCPYCTSTFEIEDYNEKNTAIAEKDSETLSVNRFVCRNCGAELSSTDSPDEQLVQYCAYCGSESVMMGKADATEIPETIIPFKITKDRAKEKYAEEVKKMFFVPKEFKNPEFLEEFRGIYIPYWRTKAQLKDGTVNLSGIKYSTEGSYDYTRYYDYTIKIDDCQISTGDYDAASALDDTIARTIAPFHEDEEQPFNDVYLAGFYADKASAPVGNYKETVKKTAVTRIKEELKAVTEGASTDESDVKAKIGFKIASPKTSLFPVWFLTWKKGSRIAYSIMNGETGKLAAEVPVDYFSLAIKSLAAIAAVFAVLNFMPVFITPLKMSCIASYLLFFSTLLLKSQMKKISLRENHIFDLGNTEYFEKNKKQRKKKALSGCLIFIFFLLVCNVLALPASVETPADVTERFTAMLIFQGVFTCLTLKNVLKIKNKAALIPLVFGVLCQFAGIALSDMNRPHDYWFLGITIICNIGMILNLIFSIYYINYMVTRPVPNYYRRKGADNGR